MYFFNIVRFDNPKDCTVKSIFFFIFPKPVSVALYDIVENLTSYARTSANKDPLK